MGRMDNLSSHTRHAQHTELHFSSFRLDARTGSESAHRRGTVSRPSGTAPSGPLVTGMVTLKGVKRPLDSSALRRLHSS